MDIVTSLQPGVIDASQIHKHRLRQALLVSHKHANTHWTRCCHTLDQVLLMPRQYTNTDCIRRYWCLTNTQTHTAPGVIDASQIHKHRLHQVLLLSHKHANTHWNRCYWCLANTQTQTASGVIGVSQTRKHTLHQALLMPRKYINTDCIRCYWCLTGFRHVHTCSTCPQTWCIRFHVT